MNKEKQSYNQLKSIKKLFIDYLWDSKKDSHTVIRGIIWLNLSIVSLSIPTFFIQLFRYLSAHFLINHVEWKNIFIVIYLFNAFLFTIGIWISVLCLVMFFINILLSIYYGIKGNGKEK